MHPVAGGPPPADSDPTQEAKYRACGIAGHKEYQRVKYTVSQTLPVVDIDLD